MKKLLVVSCAALAIAACNRSDTEGADANNIIVTDDNSGAVVSDGTAAAALPTTAADFVNAAAASDRFEVESSKLVQASGSGAPADVRKFADQMVKGHTESTNKLKAIVSGLNPPLIPDDALNADQQAALAGIEGKTGAELGAAYAAAQVSAHEKTLAVLNAYASGGDNPQLVEFAKSMIPVVTAHLNMANSLK